MISLFLLLRSPSQSYDTGRPWRHLNPGTSQCNAISDDKVNPEFAIYWDELRPFHSDSQSNAQP